MTVRDLDQIEVDLLLRLADLAEEQGQPLAAAVVMAASGLETEFARRLRHLMEHGLVRYERTRPLAEDRQLLVLTSKGAVRVVAERPAARTPLPGVRSRLGPLAEGQNDA